jgi:hypothetical protein
VATDALWAAATLGYGPTSSEAIQTLLQPVFEHLATGAIDATPYQGPLYSITTDASPWRWNGGRLARFLGACKALGVDLQPQLVASWIKVYTNNVQGTYWSAGSHDWQAGGFWEMLPVLSVGMAYWGECEGGDKGGAAEVQDMLLGNLLERMERQADARYRFADAELREVWGLLLELADSRDKGWLAMTLGEVRCKGSRGSMLEVVIAQPWWESAESCREFVEHHLLPWLADTPAYYVPGSLIRNTEVMVERYGIQVPGLDAALAFEGQEEKDDFEDDDYYELYNNDIIIRGKWMMDGADSIDEAIEMLQNEIEGLKAYKEEGWELQEPIRDDYGFLRRE